MDYSLLRKRSSALRSHEIADTITKQRALELNTITTTVFCDITQKWIRETISLTRAPTHREPAPQQHNPVGASRPRVVMDRDVAFRKKYKNLLSKSVKQRVEQAALQVEATQHNRVVATSTPLEIKIGE